MQTVSAMYTFFLAMVLYPDVLRKAQAEVDAVVGADRLPGFADREKLPYVDAMVKETLRWNPVVPMGAYECGGGLSTASSCGVVGPYRCAACGDGGRRV